MNQDQIEAIRSGIKYATIGMAGAPVLVKAGATIAGVTVGTAAVNIAAATGAVAGFYLGVYFVLKQKKVIDENFRKLRCA